MKNASRFLLTGALALTITAAVAADTRLGTSPVKTGAPAAPMTITTKPAVPTTPCGQEGVQPGFQRTPGTKAQAALKASPMIGAIGDTVPLKAKLSLGGKPVHNHTLHFRVNNVSVGSDKTDGQGEARVMYKVPNEMGPKTIQVRYNGSAECSAAQDTASFGTVKSATKITLTPPANVTAGKPLTVPGKLTRITDQLGIDGREIEVRINNVPAGKVTTMNGSFSIKYDVPGNKTGSVPVEARFAGDTLYVPNVANAAVPIKAPPAKVYLFWNNAEGRIGDTITLTGCLGRSATTPCAQPVAGQKVRFWADRGPRWHPSIQVPAFQLGSGNTNAQGKVTVQWKAELATGSLSNKDLPQSYTLWAHADVDYNQYSLEKKSDPTLKVNRTPSALAITAPAGAQIGKTITLKVRLTRTSDNGPIKGAKVTGPFGVQTTNDNGEATANYTVSSQLGTGTRPLTFKFAGEHRYLPTENSKNIQISPSTN
jgi:hypothetical protein